MNAPLKHDGTCWGATSDQAGLLARIRAIGPILESNADALEALRSIRMSHVFAPESLGGAQPSPARGLELTEAITCHSGSAD